MFLVDDRRSTNKHAQAKEGMNRIESSRFPKVTIMVGVSRHLIPGLSFRDSSCRQIGFNTIADDSFDSFDCTRWHSFAPCCVRGAVFGDSFWNGVPACSTLVLIRPTSDGHYSDF